MTRAKVTGTRKSQTSDEDNRVFFLPKKYTLFNNGTAGLIQWWGLVEFANGQTMQVDYPYAFAICDLLAGRGIKIENDYTPGDR